MVAKPHEVIDLWYQALGAEIGIAIAFNGDDDRRWLINSLYYARQQSGDVRLDALMIFQTPPKEKEIWIAHKRD